MTVTESNEYSEAVDKLVADPILQDMVVGLRDVPDSEIMHGVDEPRFEFMTRANQQYSQRGGEHGAFIGSVAQAIIRIRLERGRCHVPAYLERYVPFIPGGARLQELMDDTESTLAEVRTEAADAWTAFETLRNLHEAGLLK